MASGFFVVLRLTHVGHSLAIPLSQTLDGDRSRDCTLLSFARVGFIYRHGLWFLTAWFTFSIHRGIIPLCSFQSASPCLFPSMRCSAVPDNIRVAIQSYHMRRIEKADGIMYDLCTTGDATFTGTSLSGWMDTRTHAHTHPTTSMSPYATYGGWGQLYLRIYCCSHTWKYYDVH